MRIRHITLIRPPIVQPKTMLASERGTPPLSIACLVASVKKRGLSVTAIDAFGESIEQFTRIGDTELYANGLTTDEIIARIPQHTDLIGISCMFSNEWIAHRGVIQAITERFPDKPVIAGGEHVTACAEYVLRSCPGVIACVLGEGEETLNELIDALEADAPLENTAGLCIRAPQREGFIRTAPRQRIRNLDSLPWPDWDEVPIEQYLDSGIGYGIVRGRNMPMLATRGCPFRCSFCSNPQMWGRLWNVRAAADVVAEMKSHVNKYRAESFSFYDLTTVVRRDWILEFANLLIAEGLTLPWQMPAGTRSEALDAEVVSKMKEAGCVGITYAPESGSLITLKRVHKQVKLDNMLKSMRACVRVGMLSKAAFVIGFPGETLREMSKTTRIIAYMAWIGLNDVAVHTYAAYPGSEFFEELRAAGRIPPEGEEYDLFLAKAVFNNYFEVQSWSSSVSSRMLAAISLGSIMLFYAVQYIRRPWRLFQSLARIVLSKPHTLIERTIWTTFHMNKSMSASPGATGRVQTAGATSNAD